MVIWLVSSAEGRHILFFFTWNTSLTEQALVFVGNNEFHIPHKALYLILSPLPHKKF